MRLPETLIPCGVALALVAGCTSDQVEQPVPSSAEVSVAAVHHEVGVSFNNAQEFWRDQQLGGLAVTLVEPKDDVPVTCGTETVSPQKAKEVIAAACLPTNQLIVWDKPLAKQASEAVKKGAVLKDVVALVVNQRVAAFVQKQLTVVGDQKTAGMKVAQADCYAGAAMREVNPAAAESVKIFFDGIDEAIGLPDVKHGTAQQRLANFMVGYQQDGKCENVLSLAIPPTVS